MDLPRILPDRQRTEPVLFGVFIHDDLKKTSLGEKTGEPPQIVQTAQKEPLGRNIQF